MEKRKIVFATNNKHKLEEVRAILNDSIEVLSLADIGFSGDIPETQDTIEGNASQKAHYIYERFSLPVFADDTGLCINALGGRPGVYSARFAGEGCTSKDNCRKVLDELGDESDRSAYFKTVISLIDKGEERQFEGRVDGVITADYIGDRGFGYDPLFRPIGEAQTFAEMSQQRKNSISHRGLAVNKLTEYLLS